MKDIMAEIANSYEDEIELIDILRVLWEWKFLVLFGTLAFGIISVIYSLAMPRVYKTEMTIQPGFLRIDDDGEMIYVNSLKNISGRINAGIYDQLILSGVINKDEGNSEKKTIAFGLNIPAESNVLKVDYETTDLKEGSAVLNYLFKLIENEENVLLTGIIANINHMIAMNKAEIEKSNNLIHSYEESVKTIDKRITEIYKDIEGINKNNIFLSYERKKLLGKKSDENESISALLYSNTIQQSIQFVNRVKKDLNEQQALKEEENQKIIVEKDIRKRALQEAYSLERDRDRIQKIKIIVSPEDSNNNPIKPGRSIVFLALIFGFFLFVFCSFLAEYLNNNKITDGKNI